MEKEAVCPKCGQKIIVDSVSYLEAGAPVHHCKDISQLVKEAKWKIINK